MKIEKSMFMLLAFYCLQLWTSQSSAQQPTDFDAIVASPIVYTENALLSADGRYAGYEQRSSNKSDLIIKQVLGRWEKKISGGLRRAIGFTNDSKCMLYHEGKGQDSVAVLQLGTEKSRYITAVKKMIIPKGKYLDKVLYQTTNDELVIEELLSGKKHLLGKVRRFEVAADDRTVLLMSAYEVVKEKWEWLDLSTGKINKIASGGIYSNPKWSKDFKALAFLERIGEITKVKWFEKNKGTIDLADDQNLYKASQLYIAEIAVVNQDNASIELQLQNKVDPVFDTSDLKAGVNIWSYTDRLLHPAKPSTPGITNSFYKALLFNHSGSVLRLANDSTTVHDQKNDWYICSNETGFFIVSALNGRSIQLLNIPRDEKVRNLEFVSADGNFAVYYYKNQYYRYDIEKQQSYLIDVSKKSAIWHQRDYLEAELGYYDAVYPNVTSLTGNLFRVRDQYDIWIVDATGRQDPICMTNGYGVRNNIVFEVLKTKNIGGEEVRLNGQLILKAFNVATKQAGFFTCDALKAKDPVQLVLDDYKYNQPMRSADGSAWLFTKESTDKSPNYFLTKDFKKLVPVSANYPEATVNGIEVALISGKLLDGRLVQAMLFKPKGFDSTKKYPVIINYYEKKTDEKNAFLQSHWINADVNIPWFLSRGYLVMQTDILYKRGYTGASALNSINATTDELVKLRYVDSARLGLTGHSFGGYETLYLITHTNRFAAFMAGAAIADLLSFKHSEHFQIRMYTTIWENTSGYIDNSPVFNIDKVKRPLLMMHNREDLNVEFSNGMEFFLGMRRLGKPCWLLEYEGEKHTVDKPENQKDFTIRMTQFYDHYLKDAPAPRWMIDGMPYTDQKYTPGYELDRTGRTPGPGINSPEDKKKIDAYSKIPLAEKLEPLVNNKK